MAGYIIVPDIRTQKGVYDKAHYYYYLNYDDRIWVVRPYGLQYRKHWGPTTVVPVRKLQSGTVNNYPNYQITRIYDQADLPFISSDNLRYLCMEGNELILYKDGDSKGTQYQRVSSEEMLLRKLIKPTKV